LKVEFACYTRNFGVSLGFCMVEVKDKWWWFYLFFNTWLAEKRMVHYFLWLK